MAPHTGRAATAPTRQVVTWRSTQKLQLSQLQSLIEYMVQDLVAPSAPPVSKLRRPAHLRQADADGQVVAAICVLDNLVAVNAFGSLNDSQTVTAPPAHAQNTSE